MPEVQNWRTEPLLSRLTALVQDRYPELSEVQALNAALDAACTAMNGVAWGKALESAVAWAKTTES